MRASTEEIAQVCGVAHDASLRGAGLSLRELRERCRYDELRDRLAEDAIGEYVTTHPELIEQWSMYSDDKRTSGGWYFLDEGGGWVVGRLDGGSRRSDETRYVSAPAACAAFIIKEMDFWLSVSREDGASSCLVPWWKNLLGAVICGVVSLVAPVSSVRAEPARPPASAKESPRGKDLVVVGTVTKVVLRNHAPSETARWAVTMAVHRIVSGDFAGPTFTFAVHSPASAGLKVGKSCTIKATWTDNGYVSREPQTPCP